MREKLTGGGEQRLAQILAMARDMHGPNAMYLYRKGGEKRVLTANEATEFCAHHMVAASDDEVRQILTLWRQAFEDELRTNPDAVRYARAKGLKALELVRNT